MQTIIPHLWFDTQAVEAAKYYVSLFANSKINTISKLYDTPSGEVDTVDFTLDGVQLNAISAGPYFLAEPFRFADGHLPQRGGSGSPLRRLKGRRNSADAARGLPVPASGMSGLRIDSASTGSSAILKPMRLRRRFAPSFSLRATPAAKRNEALAFYSSVFTSAKTGYVSHYQPGEAMVERAKVNYAELTLGGFQLVAMDHGAGGTESFNEAFSLMVLCKDIRRRSTTFGRNFPPRRKRSNAAGSRTSSAFPGRSCRNSSGACLKPPPKKKPSELHNRFSAWKKLDIAALEQARRG